MLGTEGTKVLAHPKGCLVFPELAWSGVEELSQACGFSRTWGRQGNYSPCRPGPPASTSRRFCPLSLEQWPLSVSGEWGQLPPSRAYLTLPQTLDTMLDLEW